jgi:thiol-disulfide isomerase/thioredoxin
MLASDKWTLVLLLAIIFGCAFVVKYFRLQENFSTDSCDDLNNKLIVVYSPQCGHCKALAPVWDEVTTKFGSDVKAIDATDAANRAFIERAKVGGYPFIARVDANGNIEEYKGERTTDSISNFFNQ